MKSMLCFMLGDMDEAERSFGQGLVQCPQSHELRLEFIDFLIGQKRYSEVPSQLIQALLYTSQNDVAYFRLAQNALKLRRLDLAARFLHICLSIDVANPEALSILGKIYELKGDGDMSNKLKSKANEIRGMRDLPKII